ncbi:YggS family pyridoxal phosphate-dependent enzyme [Clostridium sp. DL1XJH146]
MEIKKKIDCIMSNITSETHLIAVSKTRTIDEMDKVYKIGIRDFGENKVQELIDKYDKFHDDVKWHFIGHLQKNKVKYLVGKVFLIHSLDSIKLLKEIERIYTKEGEIANLLVQINIGRDERKSGIMIEELENLLIECEKCKNIRIKGLMTVIPRGIEEDNIIYFKKMKNIFDDIGNRNFRNITMEYLSMGMTGDYMFAVNNGGNMIRIGTGIFGERNYNKEL